MPKAKKRVMRKGSKSVQIKGANRKGSSNKKDSKKLILFRNILLVILLTVLVAILFLRFAGVTGNVVNSKCTYTIKSGDTIGSLAPLWGTSISDLLSVNPQIVNPNLIVTGQILNVPSTASNFDCPPDLDLTDNYQAPEWNSGSSDTSKIEGQLGNWGDDPDWQSPIWDEVGFIFAILFGQTGYDVAISKIIFALLSFMFVFYIVGKVNESMDLKLGSVVKVFVSILLGILFTRWVGQDGLIKAVLMPYNAIGATLATLIPIAIIFYLFFFLKPFNTSKYGPLRVVGLALLAGFFIMNWIWVTSGNWGSSDKPQYSYVYLIAAGITVLILIFQKRILLEFKWALALEGVDAQNRNLVESYRLAILNKERLMANLDPKSTAYKEYQRDREELMNEILKLTRYKLK